MASKDSNGLVISLSIFVLLTIGLGVAWYMTWAHSADVQRELAAAQKAEQNSKGTIQDQIAQLNSLKQIIGHPGDGADEVVAGVQTEIAKWAGNGAAIAFARAPLVADAASNNASPIEDIGY